MKTYTLTSIDAKGGNRSGWNSALWGSYSLFASTGARQLIGGDGSAYFTTYIKFDESTLTTLRSKTVTSITLTITVKTGRIPANGTQSYPIGIKANSLSGTTSQTDAWLRTSSGGAAQTIGYICNQTTGGGYIDASNTPLTIDVTSAGVPQYGYVLGPASSSIRSYVELVTSGTATLTVVTNESDSNNFSLAYNANNGSGAPATQTASSTASTYSFTISSTIPYRTGYSFLGWSTSSSATSASYSPGGYITVYTGTTTLYAVWKILTYSVTYNANGGSGAPAAQTKTHDVYLELSLTVPTRTGYTFLGWGTYSSATTASYQPGSTYTANAALNLYAVWQVITYTVNYNKGSYGTGTNTYATKTYNVTLVLSGAIFTRSGFSQTGWATSDGGAQAYALGANYTSNAGTTLYPVWTAGRSSVYADNGTLGTPQTITISRLNDSYTHTLTYRYGNSTGTIATNTSSVSVSWTPATSLASQFPSATSGTCTITCETFSGNTSLGISTAYVTLAIPDSIKCTISSVTLAEAVSGIASQFGGYVQNKSKINVTVNTSTSNSGGATVRSYSIAINGQTLTTNGATTGLLSTSGSNSYTATITDTRGRIATYTGTFTVFSYVAPSITQTSQRDSSTPSTINVTYSWNISPVNNNNTKTIEVMYRVFGSSVPPTTATTITPSDYSGTNATYAITGLDPYAAYEIFVTASDYFSSATITVNVAGDTGRVFHISKTDKTISRHGANISDGWDHQYFNERFHGILDVTPRRCSANLTTRGWYRVMAFAYSNGADVVGAGGIQIDFVINRSVGNTDNETHRITLEMAYNNVGFVNESSRSNALGITKIRYNANTTGTTKYGYVDIYYDLSVSNPVYVDFTVHQAVAFVQASITAPDPTGVDDSPANETEMAKYVFIATSGKKNTFTPAYGASAFGGCWYARNGEYVTVHVGLTGLTANTTYTIGTLPVGHRPIVQCCSAGSSATYDAEAHLYIRDTGNIEVWSPNTAASLDATFMWR